MGRKLRAGAQSSADNYVNNLQDLKKAIRKNYEQMDFENVTLKQKFEEVVDEITADCNRVISTIEQNTFD